MIVTRINFIFSIFLNKIHLIRIKQIHIIIIVNSGKFGARRLSAITSPISHQLTIAQNKLALIAYEKIYYFL
ncbi:hypothetical protein [Candidatus Tisiphia endosymbiont of Sialis lutaria]|uniref:hypothetical protein n=1 Tax=Candidatus Tisiphia endosymbiont of Sialis lutaria TaxID=2029164 RepID=UPI00312CB6A4